MESDDEFMSGLSSEEGDIVEVESDASFGDDGEYYILLVDSLDSTPLDCGGAWDPPEGIQ